MQEYEKFLFQRCQNGSSVIMNKNCIIVEPERMLFLLNKVGKQIHIPSDGRWMLIPIHTFKASLGMANLAEYSLEELGRHVFHLGFFGTMQFHFAHIEGLRRYLLSEDQITPDQFLVLLQSELKPAVSKAVSDILGNRLIDYRKIRDEMLPSISEVVNRVLFSELFSRGICLHSGSFHIENISRPVMKRPA